MKEPTVTIPWSFMHKGPTTINKASLDALEKQLRLRCSEIGINPADYSSVEIDAPYFIHRLASAVSNSLKKREFVMVYNSTGVRHANIRFKA